MYNPRNDFSKAEWKDVEARTQEVEVSLAEKLLVNVFTPPDLFIHPLTAAATEKVLDVFGQLQETKYGEFLRYMAKQPKGPLSRRARRMWDGKNKDYAQLVAIKESRGEIPSEIKRLYFCSPCGVAKLAALYIRENK